MARCKKWANNMLVACLLMAAASAQASDKVIVVGQAIDLSGPNGSIGRDYVAGITTYFDSINVKGGINGRKIRFIARDDHGAPVEAAALTTELINQERADYLLGGIGAESTLAATDTQAFRQSRHVLFAPLANSATLPGVRAIFWRPSVERELVFVLDHFRKLGVTKVGIALQASPQNERTRQYIAAELRQRGITLTGVAPVTGSPGAIESAARALSAGGPRLVIAIADTISLAQFLKAFRKHDAATFVAGTSLTNLATLREIAGPAATEFTVFSQVVPNPGSSASVLQSEHIAMMRKFRDEPASAMTLEGFAVAKTLVRTIQADNGGKGLQALSAGKAAIDLGGMTMTTGRSTNLSSYVDIALFKRGGGLMY